MPIDSRSWFSNQKIFITIVPRSPLLHHHRQDKRTSPVERKPRCCALVTSEPGVLCCSKAGRTDDHTVSSAAACLPFVTQTSFQ